MLLLTNYCMITQGTPISIAREGGIRVSLAASVDFLIFGSNSFCLFFRYAVIADTMVHSHFYVNILLIGTTLLLHLKSKYISTILKIFLIILNWYLLKYICYFFVLYYFLSGIKVCLF